jgi:HK97 family phage portal protein
MPSIFDRIGNAYAAFQSDRTQIDDGPANVGPGGFSMTWNPFTGQFNDFQPAASLEQFGQNPYLYSAAHVVAAEAARIPLILKQHVSKNEDRIVEDHRADELLKRPVPMQGRPGRSHLTGMQLRYVRNLHLILNGEAFWLMDDFRAEQFGGGPSSIKPLLAANMEVKADIHGFPTEFIYNYGGQKISYPPEAIVHFKMMDPASIIRGHSPMKSARWAVGSYRKGEEMNFYRLDNNAMPDGVLTSEQQIPDKTRDSLLEKFLAKFGTPKKKARVGFMPWGVKYESLTQTNKDMQYVELMERSRDAILANWRVPLDVLGMTKDNTRANADAALFTFMRYTILPLIEIEADTLTSDFIPMFAQTQNMFYGYDDFIPENMDDKRKNLESLFGMGGLKPNEARQEMGYDESRDPNAERMYLPFSYTPLDEVSVKTETPDPDEPTPKKKDEPAAKPVPDPKKPKEKQITQALDPEDELLDALFEQKRFSVLLDPFMTRGFARGVEMAKRSKSKVKITDILTAQMRQGLKAQSVKISAQVLDTTQKDLKKLVEEAVQNGFGSAKLAANIRKEFENVAPIRARATARTVLTGSINNGQFRTLVAEGFKEKTWITITDGRQRDSHGKAHGQTVGINEPFLLEGGAAQFPGDDNLPSGELISCRCDIVGSGTTDAYQRSHYEQFLKVHGELETQMVAALTQEFIRQGERAIKALPN